MGTKKKLTHIERKEITYRRSTKQVVRKKKNSTAKNSRAINKK